MTWGDENSIIYEHCCKCDSHTGRAGKCEDSLYIEDEGPFCEGCYFERLEELPGEMVSVRGRIADMGRELGRLRYYLGRNRIANDNERLRKRLTAAEAVCSAAERLGDDVPLGIRWALGPWKAIRDAQEGGKDNDLHA